MWSDILKRSKIKIIGSVYRQILLEYLEETGFLDSYEVVDILDNSMIEKYIRLHKEHRGGTKMVGNKSSVKTKLNSHLASYLPDNYERTTSPYMKERARGGNFVVKIPQSEDLEKIRTSRGDRLRLKDWDAFKKSLRAGLNTIVPRDIYGRKSSVRIVDGDFVDNKATLNVSFRSLQTDRRYIHINFIEEDGDYYFTTIEGNIQIFDNEVIQTEAQLRERVIDLVEEFYIQEKKEYDLRQKEEIFVN